MVDVLIATALDLVNPKHLQLVYQLLLTGQTCNQFV